MPEGPFGGPRFTNLGPLSRSTKEELEAQWDECPESGKPREICKAIKRRALAILKGQDFYAQCSTLEEINSGSCGRVARSVARDVDGVRVFRAGDGNHVWIEYHEMHYDAEVPTGVDGPFKLPFFGRISPDVVFRLARDAAQMEGREPPETVDDIIHDITEEVS